MEEEEDTAAAAEQKGDEPCCEAAGEHLCSARSGHCRCRGAACGGECSRRGAREVSEKEEAEPGVEKVVREWQEGR